MLHAFLAAAAAEPVETGLAAAHSRSLQISVSMKANPLTAPPPPPPPLKLNKPPPQIVGSHSCFFFGLGFIINFHSADIYPPPVSAHTRRPSRLRGGWGGTELMSARCNSPEQIEYCPLSLSAQLPNQASEHDGANAAAKRREGL